MMHGQKNIKKVIAVYREDTNAVRKLFRVKITVVIVKWRDLIGRLSENNFRVK
jgi:hypothetical protein